MKKFNNKGFAISTMLYGLLIIIVLVVGTILATMAFNRKTSKEFTSEVIEELEGKLGSSYSPYFKVYNYNEKSCPTGDEETCVETDCYKEGKSECSVGTIVDYKVNNEKTITFNVLKDNRSTLIMQSKDSIVTSKWYTGSDTTTYPGDALDALKNATQDWTNVEELNYITGKSWFGIQPWTNAFCSNAIYKDCSGAATQKNREGDRARIILLQELLSFGCTSSNYSCDNWIRPSNTSVCYWTMNAGIKDYMAWYLQGSSVHSKNISYECGIRAVVIVKKVK